MAATPSPSKFSEEVIDLGETPASGARILSHAVSFDEFHLAVLFESAAGVRYIKLYGKPNPLEIAANPQFRPRRFRYSQITTLSLEYFAPVVPETLQFVLKSSLISIISGNEILVWADFNRAQRYSVPLGYRLLPVLPHFVVSSSSQSLRPICLVQQEQPQQRIRGGVDYVSVQVCYFQEMPGPAIPAGVLNLADKEYAMVQFAHFDIPLAEFHPNTNMMRTYLNTVFVKSGTEAFYMFQQQMTAGPNRGYFLNNLGEQPNLVGTILSQTGDYCFLRQIPDADAAYLEEFKAIGGETNGGKRYLVPAAAAPPATGGGRTKRRATRSAHAESPTAFPTLTQVRLELLKAQATSPDTYLICHDTQRILVWDTRQPGHPRPIEPEVLRIPAGIVRVQATAQFETGRTKLIVHCADDQLRIIDLYAKNAQAVLDLVAAWTARGPSVKKLGLYEQDDMMKHFRQIFKNNNLKHVLSQNESIATFFMGRDTRTNNQVVSVEIDFKKFRILKSNWIMAQQLFFANLPEEEDIERMVRRPAVLTYAFQFTTRHRGPGPNPEEPAFHNWVVEVRLNGIPLNMLNIHQFRASIYNYFHYMPREGANPDFPGIQLNEQLFLNIFKLVDMNLPAMPPEMRTRERLHKALLLILNGASILTQYQKPGDVRFNWLSNEEPRSLNVYRGVYRMLKDGLNADDLLPWKALQRRKGPQRAPLSMGGAQPALNHYELANRSRRIPPNQMPAFWNQELRSDSELEEYPVSSNIVWVGPRGLGEEFVAGQLPAEKIGMGTPERKKTPENIVWRFAGYPVYLKNVQRVARQQASRDPRLPGTAAQLMPPPPDVNRRPQSAVRPYDFKNGDTDLALFWFPAGTSYPPPLDSSLTIPGPNDIVFQIWKGMLDMNALGPMWLHAIEYRESSLLEILQENMRTEAFITLYANALLATFKNKYAAAKAAAGGVEPAVEFAYVVPNPDPDQAPAPPIEWVYNGEKPSMQPIKMLIDALKIRRNTDVWFEALLNFPQILWFLLPREAAESQMISNYHIVLLNDPCIKQRRLRKATTPLRLRALPADILEERSGGAVNLAIPASDAVGLKPLITMHLFNQPGNVNYASLISTLRPDGPDGVNRGVVQHPLILAYNSPTPEEIAAQQAAEEAAAEAAFLEEQAAAEAGFAAAQGQAGGYAPSGRTPRQRCVPKKNVECRKSAPNSRRARK